MSVMSEDMNLPESLERLEISPEKIDCCKNDDRISGNQLSPAGRDSDPERFLENLSINAVCPKGSCQCNKRKDSAGREKGLKRLTHKRPILRRSKLSQAVLRAPILRLPGSSGSELSGSPPLASTPEGVKPLTAFVPEPSSSSNEDVLSSNQTASINSEGRRVTSAQSTCCAVQARLSEQAHPSSSSTSDDTSMDELASYFDIFVHIPKKMSRMAEMMYI